MAPSCAASLNRAQARAHKSNILSRSPIVGWVNGNLAGKLVPLARLLEQALEPVAHLICASALLVPAYPRGSRSSRSRTVTLVIIPTHSSSALSADSQYTSSTLPTCVRLKLGTSFSSAEPYSALRTSAVEWKGSWPSSGMRTTRIEPRTEKEDGRGGSWGGWGGWGGEGGDGGGSGGEGGDGGDDGGDGGGGEGGSGGGDGGHTFVSSVWLVTELHIKHGVATLVVSPSATHSLLT
eukprot:scaffold27378_cov58-Phaeocystis_antarctica.AAC.2